MTPDKTVKAFLKSKCSSGKVLLALNVRQDQKSKSADGVRQGNHWNLLVMDIKENYVVIH